MLVVPQSCSYTYESARDIPYRFHVIHDLTDIGEDVALVEFCRSDPVDDLINLAHNPPALIHRRHGRQLITTERSDAWDSDKTWVVISRGYEEFQEKSDSPIHYLLGRMSSFSVEAK